MGGLLTLSVSDVSITYYLITSSPLLKTNSITGTSSVPLIVCSYQTGAIHSQDAISDPQSAVGGSRTVRDQSPDVNAWSVERSVLQEGEVLQCVQDVCVSII